MPQCLRMPHLVIATKEYKMTALNRSILHGISQCLPCFATNAKHVAHALVQICARFPLHLTLPVSPYAITCVELARCWGGIRAIKAEPPRLLNAGLVHAASSGPRCGVTIVVALVEGRVSTSECTFIHQGRGLRAGGTPRAHQLSYELPSGFQMDES